MLPAFEDFLKLNYFCHFVVTVLVDAGEGEDIYMAALFFDIYPEIDKNTENLVTHCLSHKCIEWQ